MGCSPLAHWLEPGWENIGSRDNKSEPESIDVNPNPDNFQVLDVREYRYMWLARVRYPNCINYEGEKVMLLREDPRGLKRLDPHFDNDGLVIARFPPTKEGWGMAKRVAEWLSGKG